MFSGFGISKCFKEEILTPRILIQDKKQSDEQPRTADMWPDELNKLFRGKISKFGEREREREREREKGIYNTSNNSFHKIKNVIR